MTTTTTATVNDAETSLPSLFNIQYPNCTRGMYSLRQPFKTMPKVLTPTVRQPTPVRILTPIADEEPSKQEQRIQSIPVPRQVSKRNAEVQCLLLTPNVRHDMAVQTQIDRQRTAVNYLNDDVDLSPRYRLKKKPRAIEQYQKIYEIWDIRSAPLPMIQGTRRKEPQARPTRNRNPIIEYYDDDDDGEGDEQSDYEDERILYARQPKKIIKKTYLPPNVRMMCVRDDANRASY